MIKKILKAVSFCLILMLVLNVVQNQIVPFEKQDTNQANSFYNDIEKNSVDVLAIGASTILVDVSPLALYEETGIVSHVRGNSRQSPQVMWLVTKDSLKTQRPKLVIYNGAMLLNTIDFDKEEAWTRRGMDYLKLSKEKLQVARYITKHSEDQTLSSYVFPILRYHTRWTEVASGEELQPPEAGKYDFHHGQYAVYKTVAIENFRDINMANTGVVEISDTSFKYYKKSVELCKENDISVMIIVTPDMRWTEGKHQAIADACMKLGVPLLDFNSKEMDEKIDINWEIDCYNDHHLNARGSVKFTKYLGKYIQEKYNLTSNPSEKVDKQFRNDIKAFKKELKDYF